MEKANGWTVLDFKFFQTYIDDSASKKYTFTKTRLQNLAHVDDLNSTFIPLIEMNEVDPIRVVNIFRSTTTVNAALMHQIFWIVNQGMFK